jgi:hypothetical protein
MVEEYSTYPTNIKCYEKLMSIGKGSYSNVINYINIPQNINIIAYLIIYENLF